MIQFEHLKIYNWLDAIRGMRNSWESWDKMDSQYIPTENGLEFQFGPNDYVLALGLARAGNDHAKFMRQILVSVDITAPEYWWREQATYKVGTVENSTSQMHKMGSRHLTVDDFSFDSVGIREQLLIEHLNQLIEEWWATGKKKPSPEWRKLLQHVPQSFNYRRTCTLNYQVLKNMYHSRRLHRLQEWRDFAAWMETLPYAELITLKK